MTPSVRPTATSPSTVPASRPQRPRRALVVRIALALACASLSACQRPEPATEEFPARAGAGPAVDVRIGMAYGPRVSPAYENRPTPLFYGAGFLPKIPVFETLVGMDEQGRPTPGLAERWEVSPDGRTVTFWLRPRARFHDGRACDAELVAAHFRRLGSDEDRFLGMFRYLESVEPVGAHSLRFVLERPYPLLSDLPLVNPNAVVVPEAPRDADPAVLVGTGPFRFESFTPMERAVYRRFEAYDGRWPRVGSFSLELLLGGTHRSDVLTWALERGRVDAIVEDWSPAIPRDKALSLAERPGFRLLEGRGSSVVFLAFQHDRAPFHDQASRSFVAGAIDRAALIDLTEQGFADPVSTLFAPGVSDWPAHASPPPRPDALPRALVDAEPVLLAPASDPAGLLCAAEIARQLWAKGVRVRVETSSSGSSGWDRINRRDYDMLLVRTWGAPYDPHATLLARFAPEPERKTAVETVPYYTSAELTGWIERSFSGQPGSPERRDAYAAIQELIDREAAVVPLFVPRRIAVVSSRVRGLALGPHGYGLDIEALERAD